MDKAQAAKVADAALEALREVARRFGLTVERVGAGKYSATTFEMKVGFSESVGGVVMSGEARDFQHNAGLGVLGALKPEDLGRSFEHKGETHTVAGLRARAHTRPVVTKGPGGRTFFWPVDAVVRLLHPEVRLPSEREKEAEYFREWCRVWGLREEDLGRSFVEGGFRYRIVGARSSKSAPIIVEGGPKGDELRAVPLEQIRRILAQPDAK